MKIGSGMISMQMKVMACTLVLALAGCSSANGPSSNTAVDGPAPYSEDGYEKQTIIDEAGEFLGVGAEAVGGVIEKIFKSQGEPIGYIKAEEAGGGLVFGLRYGGGTLTHKIEGDTPVHWTGPSIGLDAGGEVAKVFALVYNLHDVEEIYKRFGALEGQLYYVGGMGVTYVQHNDVVIAIIRVGVGLRGQASVGYYKFSKKRKIMPF